MDEKKELTSLGISCVGAFALLAMGVLIVAVAVSLGWGWIVPSVFPGAVREGLLPSSLTLFEALKIVLLLGTLGLKRKVKKPDEERKGAMKASINVATGLLDLIVRGVLIVLLWGWVVPDLFPLLVARGWIPEHLSLWQAILLSLLTALLRL